MMKCKYPEYKCLLRKGDSCNYSTCMIENNHQPLPRLKIRKKCPLLNKPCIKSECMWFVDEDCAVTRSAKK